jgi:hypothetical protein
MAGEVDGGGVTGAIGLIGGAIASFLHGFFAITAKELVRLITYLKNALVEVSKQLLVGLVRLGRALARALVQLIRVTWNVVRSFLIWAARKLAALEKFLKDQFAPVLKFLKKLKDNLDLFYRRFIRPILDVIDFLRQINRVLQVLHIDFLRKVDETLAKIEQRIEDPFLWVRSHITELENWINRIVTLDGIFQRLTLIRSMSSYAPSWINGFWNTQLDPSTLPPPGAPPGPHYPLEAVENNGRELGRSYMGEDNRMRSFVEVLQPIWRVAAGLDPPVDLPP